VGFLIIILLGFLLIWLFVVLPQRRRQSAHNALIDSLEPGAEVIFGNGLYGTVTEVGDEWIRLEIADGVEVRAVKRAIGGIVPPEEEPEEYLDEEEDEVEALDESVEQERR
jgi:preprotein translocase subunit YajC